jgi:hypothetical protein
MSDAERAAFRPRDGALRFLKPDGGSFDSVAPDHTQPLGDWRQLPAIHGQLGIRIDMNTAATRRAGEKMDYGLGIEVLLPAGSLIVARADMRFGRADFLFHLKQNGVAFVIKSHAGAAILKVRAPTSYE